MNQDEPRKITSNAEALLLQLHESLEKLKNHKGPFNITPEIEKELKDLQEIVDMIQTMDEEALRKMGISPQENLAETLHDPNIPTKTKQLLKMSQSIETDARRLKLAYSRAAKQVKDKTKKEKDHVRESKRARRKLFKPIGGDKNWIPM
jgi:hypothetical protein